MSALRAVQQHLQSIRQGSFEPDDYLMPWFTPELVQLFVGHAVEQRPESVLFDIGRPLDCHRNALELATANQEASAWFGFRLDGWGWWLHSWAIQQDVLIDSGPRTMSPLYVGIPWGYELFRVIPKKPGSSIDIHLPPVLRQSIFASLPGR